MNRFSVFFCASGAAILVLLACASAHAAPATKVIAGDGRSAMDCVDLVELSSGDSGIGNGGNVISNGCTDPIEAVWCYVDGDCRTETGSVTTIEPGRSWPVSKDKEIRWAACHGKNSAKFEQGSFGLRFICHNTDEPKKPEPQAENSIVLQRETSSEASSLLQAAAASAEQQGPTLDAARAAELAAAQARLEAERVEAARIAAWEADAPERERQAREAAARDLARYNAQVAAAAAAAAQAAQAPQQGATIEWTPQNDCIGTPEQCASLHQN